MESAGPFTRQLWESVQPLFRQIIDCSYIKSLTDGSLPERWFTHYLAQDVLYIIEDSRALAVTAARAEDPGETYFFIQMAKDGLDIERALQDTFIKQFQINNATEKSPAFKAYADFLLDHAFHSPYPVAAAALLPCFWIYYKAGDYVLRNAVDNNPYRKWIDTYSGEEYRQYTEHFIHIIENLGQKAVADIKNQMMRVFAEGTRYELLAFEEAAKQ
ncbi:MAG: TenA family protein [Bacteroidales bacterium]|nr:TenA family protein [Bacteroidales bacterium]MBN2762201.1 TenA family protein [Bacteroidales bacterium]